MVTIELGNIHSKVVGGNAKALMAIDNALSVDIEGASFTETYRKGIWDGKHHFFSVQTKKFPTGLIVRACRALNAINEKFSITDNRCDMFGDIPVPDQIELYSDDGVLTLRDYQINAVIEAVEKTRGIVHIATNGGKTEIACGIIKVLLPALPTGQHIAFFTHSQKIFLQTKERIEKRLGIKLGQIGMGEWDVRDVNMVMIPTISKYLKNPKHYHR